MRELVTTRMPRRFGLDPCATSRCWRRCTAGSSARATSTSSLQEALTAGAPGIQRGARQYRVGDKVMQLRNDYDKDVFNGDVGVIARADPTTARAR